MEPEELIFWIDRMNEQIKAAEKARK